MRGDGSSEGDSRSGDGDDIADTCYGGNGGRGGSTWTCIASSVANIFARTLPNRANVLSSSFVQLLQANVDAALQCLHLCFDRRCCCCCY